MASPGGVEVGRVSVRVVPDTSKFLEDAKRELKKIAGRLSVTAELELDTSKISTEMKEAKARADGEKVKLGAEVDGDGVAREARRVRKIAQKLVGAIRMTVGINTVESLAKIKAQIEIIKKAVKGYEIKIPVEFVGVSKWLAILGSVSAILLTIPSLVGAIGGAVNFVAGAFALLPALAASAAFGIGALVVGMQGFKSALSASGDPVAFAAALKQLTPSAQASAKALAGFKEPLSDIRKAVQESLFKGMAKPLSDLKTLLPPIKEGLVGSAGGIRDMAKAWIQMATSQKSIKDTGIIGKNVTKMFQEMKPAAANFGQAMRDITVVGSTFLPKLGTAVSNVTGKFADWAMKARDTGRLDQMITNFIEKTKQLGRIVADVTAGFKGIFHSMSGGKDFLDIIEGIAKAFRDWSSASDTQTTLARLADVMRTVASAAWTLFQQVFKSAGQILKDMEPFLLALAKGIGTFLAGAIRAVTPVLQSFGKWLSDNKAVMVPLVIALLSLVTAFKLAVTVGSSIVKLAEAFKTLKAAGTIVSTVAEGIVTNLKKIVTSIAQTTLKIVTAAARWVFAWTITAASAAANAARVAAAWIAETAKAVASTVASWVSMAAQATANFAKMAAAAVVNAVKIAVTWTVQMARMVATTLIELAIMVAAWVANWIRMAVVALAQAARMALAWLIAMGPIAIVIAAVIALVAVIILNWDKIVSFLTNAWNAIWDLAKTVWNAIVTFFSDIWTKISSVASEAWGRMITFFENLWDTVTGALTRAFTAVVTWAQDLPGKIAEAVRSAVSKLEEVGKFIIEGIVNGLKSVAGKIWDFIKGICSDVLDGIKAFFGISSPSRVMMQIGKWINQGWVIGLKRNASDVSSQAQKIATSVTDAFTPLTGLGSDWASSITAATPTALASVNKLMDATSGAATAQWSGQLSADETTPLEERILDALASGLKVELDGRNVTKSVNANNQANKRR